MNNWITKTLGEVCEIVNGFTPLRSNKDFWNGGTVPWFTIDDIREQGRVIGNTKQKITKLALNGSTVRVLPTESVLLCCTASVGEYAITKIPLATNQQFNGLVIKNRSLLDPTFLFFFASTLKERLLGLSGKTTIDFIPVSRLRDLAISVPPLSEQRRIVAILDDVFERVVKAKTNAEKNLANAKHIFESYLHSVLTSKEWKWKTLGALCDGVEYGSSAKSKKEGKIPVLRMGNIQNGLLNWDDLAYSDDKAEIAKYQLRHNDVLFNRTNSPELVGKSAIYKSERPAIFAGYLIRIKRKENLLDADFLNYFLNSQIALDYGKTVVISSVHQANINGSKLKEYPIPAPTLSQQRTIVSNLDALSSETKQLEAIYRQKLSSLEELKKSVLRSAFRGEL